MNILFHTKVVYSWIEAPNLWPWPYLIEQHFVGVAAGHRQEVKASMMTKSGKPSDRGVTGSAGGE